MPRRHVGEVETQFHPFLASALDTKVSGQLHASATLHPWNGPAVLIQQDGGCVPEPV